MNCSDVGPILDRLARSSAEGGIPDDAALRVHLATCSACQRAVRSLVRWDAQLTRAMSDIAIPEGLSQRLVIALLSAPSVESISKQAASTTTARTARSWVFIAGTVVCLLVGSIWGTRQLLHRPTLSAANVAMLFQRETETMPSSSISIKNLPRGWSSLSTISAQDWKHTEASGLSLTVAVKPFILRTPRGQHLEGALFMIPRSRWSPAPVTSITQAPLQYAPPHAWIVWAEGEFAYILTLNGPPPLLEQLQHQLDGPHSVL